MKKVVKCIFISSLLWCQLAFTSPCNPLLGDVQHALTAPPATDPKDEVVNRIVEWIRENPAKKVTGDVIKSLGINLNAFLGTGSYKLNTGGRLGSAYSSRFFDSPLAAWLAVKEKAKAQGLKFDLIDVKIKAYHLTPAEQLQLREIRKKEAVDRIVTWIRENPDKTVTKKVFKTLRILPYAFLGIGDYKLKSDGTPVKDNKTRFFDSPLAAWLAVKESAKAQGLKFGLIDVEIKTRYLTSVEQLQLREIRKGEAVDRIVEWIRQNPDETVTGGVFKSLGINYQAFSGMGDYKLNPDGSPGLSYSARIFDSRAQAIQACRERAQQVGIPSSVIETALQ